MRIEVLIGKLMKVFYISLFLMLALSLHASVEHKDEFIDVYLTNISNSMDEKTQLLEHIEKNLNGHFVDIGTGGDSIVIIAKQLPKNSQPTLIAADIDPLVLESIKKRRPEVIAFLNNSSGPKIELMTMSAVKMDKLTDNSLSGIGASALAHEIFSYTPSKGALDQFVTEVCRVLEKNGVLVYRDPKWVDDPDTQCIMTIKSEIGKYYASLFLTKFFDRKYSLIRDYREECCKPQIHSPSAVRMTVHLKPAQTNVQMSFPEFLKVPCSDIDYTKNFSIEASKGLLAEIQRHYLMYLRDYFAAGLLESSHFTHNLSIATLTDEQRTAIESYAHRKGIPLTNDQLDASHFPFMFHELETLRKIFSKKYTMPTQNHQDAHTTANILLGDGLDRNLFYLTDDQTLVIDPKMLALLFQGKGKGIFLYLDTTDLPLDLLEHLKLEGEEHYFYKTTDELITYMGQYSRFILKNGVKKGYCLAPIDSDHIKVVSRPLYHSVLARDTLVIDQHGNTQPPVTDKTIIHFQLQPERKAFATFKKLFQNQPSKYPSLRKWITLGNHEMLDIVSLDDTVIGAMSRTDIYAKNLTNFRVVNVFLINSKGELWIPTRNPSKTLFPLSLDCSVGGHVLSNELYFDAFCRETREEINLDPKQHSYKLLGRLTPQTHGTSAFMEVYSITYDGPVMFNPDDFVDGQWISPQKLKTMLKNGTPAKPDLKHILETCFPDA